MLEGMPTEIELQNLRSIKLSNGQDILGIILGADKKPDAPISDYIIVKHPFKIMSLMSEDRSVYLLVPFQPFSDNVNHIINVQSLVALCTISEEAKKLYLKSIEAKLKGKQIPWPTWTDNVDPKKLN